MKLTGKLLTSGFTAFIAACGPSESDFIEFSTYESPGGDFTVTIDYAHSLFAFGPETVRVFVTPAGSRARNHIVTTKISNDGGISAKNIQVKWRSNNVIEFCLSGVEQEDSILIVNLREHSYSQVNGECARPQGS